jgi:predicted nucleotidyltransferase component of viral defense system
MITPNNEYIIHKTWLYRLLRAISADDYLNGALRFKGGTCAAMRGLIDRFSVDLDFDLVVGEPELAEAGRGSLLYAKAVSTARKNLKIIIKKLGLQIQDQSTKTAQFFIKYPNSAGKRSIIKIDVTFPPPNSNKYEPVSFPEIGSVIYCQTVETMFANKLVSITDRFAKTKSIAGRDLYDIHSFFLNGLNFDADVINERTGLSAEIYINQLIKFIEKQFTQQIIDEDLNHLLPPESFKNIRKTLIPECLIMLKSHLRNIFKI